MVNTTMVKVILGPIKVAPDKEAQYRYHMVCRQALVQINEDVPEHISIKIFISTTMTFKNARAHIYLTDTSYSIENPRFSLLVFLVNLTLL